MKVSARCTAPDDVQISLTITGCLKDFKELANQLSQLQWPSWDLRSKITHVVNDATQQFYAPEERSQCDG